VKSVLALLAVIALGPLGLCACVPAATPTPDARLVATASLTPAAPATTASGQASPDPGPGAAWREYRTEELVIRLPASWQASETEVESAATRLPAFQQANPELAGFVGGADRLTGVVFSARDLRASAGQGFTDNLNIRRMTLDGESLEGLPEITSTIAAQYRQLGFDVRKTASGFEIGGLPAARIEVTFSAAGHDGKTEALSGLQWLVAAPGELWILTYTTTSDRFTALRPVFEESARAFEVR
jgi:hypothetical protein